MRKLLGASAMIAGLSLAMTGCKGLLVNVEGPDKQVTPNYCSMDARVTELESHLAALQATVNAMQKQMQPHQEPGQK